MKKAILISLIIFLLWMSGCSSNNSASTPTNNSEPIISTSEEKHTIKDIGLDEPFELITKHGNLNIKVKKVKRTDWAKREGTPDLEIILVEAECENLSFNDPMNTIFYVDPWIFAYDSSDFQLSSPSNGYDDGLYSRHPTLPIGSKARVFWAYYISPGETEIKINFNNCALLETEITD